MVFCGFGSWLKKLSQKMIISPKAIKQINAVTPKISKNRLLGDFCFSLLFDNINFYSDASVKFTGILY